jgi:hypothetical protein
LHELAAELLLVAEDAFGRGDGELGDQMTARALQYLDEAEALEKQLPKSVE